MCQPLEQAFYYWRICWLAAGGAAAGAGSGGFGGAAAAAAAAASGEGRPDTLFVILNSRACCSEHFMQATIL